MANVHEMMLLVSVRSASEAHAALAGGANWIDLKEPAVGALGAVDAEVARAVVAEIGAKCPLSAALGELREWQSSRSRDLVDVPTLKVMKLGLANCGEWPHWQDRWLDAFANCSARGKQLAAVVYADWHDACAPSPSDVLDCASRAGGKYLLIDTFYKQGLSSLEILGLDQVARLLHLARERGLTTVLAGSLRFNDLSSVAALAVDIVAIRGAACRGDRSSLLDTTLVGKFRSQLSDATRNVQDLNSCLTSVS